MQQLTEFPDAPDIESSSTDYQRRFAGATGRWFVEVQAQAMLAALADLPRPMRVLDVGGGHGQNIEALLQAGAEVTILASPQAPTDVIAPFLDRPGVTYRTGNLLSLPVADRSFDAVVSFRILAHIADWAGHISELCRVARYRVVCDYPVKRSVNALAEGLFAVKKKLESNTRYFRVFDEPDLLETFAAQGMERSFRRGEYFFPMALHRAVRSSTISQALEVATGIIGVRNAFGSPVIAAFSPASNNIDRTR